MCGTTHIVAVRRQMFNDNIMLCVFVLIQVVKTFHENLYVRYVNVIHSSDVLVFFPTIIYNNMADARIFEVEKTPAAPAVDF